MSEKKNIHIDLEYFKETGEIRTIQEYNYEATRQIIKNNPNFRIESNRVMINYIQDGTTGAYKISHISAYGLDIQKNSSFVVKVVDNGFLITHGKDQHVIIGFEYHDIADLIKEKSTKEIECFAIFDPEYWDNYDISGLDFQANTIGLGANENET